MPEPALIQEELTAPVAPTLRVVGAPDAEQPSQIPAPPQRRLEIPPYDLEAALDLERELGVSHVLAQILVRRGLSDVVAARAFLEADERHPPSAFQGIDLA